MKIVKHLRQDAARLVGVGVAVSLSACSTVGGPQTGAPAQPGAKVSASGPSPSIFASAAPAPTLSPPPSATPLDHAPATPAAPVQTAEAAHALAGGLSAAAGAQKSDGARDETKDGPIAFESPLPGYSVNSNFGLRQMSYEPHARMHEGVDIAAPKGSPIHAAAGGHVSRTGLSSSYGHFVEVAHADGLTSFYAHMSRTAGLEPGAKVSAGEVLGYVGSTGHSTGPHLHFEIRDAGKPLDPQAFLGRVFASAADLSRVETQQASVAIGHIRERVLASWHGRQHVLASWHGRRRSRSVSYAINHRVHARFAAG